MRAGHYILYCLRRNSPAKSAWRIVNNNEICTGILNFVCKIGSDTPQPTMNIDAER
jgi:hypothetical protein